MVKLSDYVIDFIKKLKVDAVFLLPGGGCMHLVDSLGKSGIKYICNLHEQASVIAADGYSQYSGNIGAALVTTGPGSTNAITGVAGAWIDSTPLLVVSGQVKRLDLIGRSGLRQRGVQEVGIISLVKPITKYAATVMRPEEIKYHLEKAAYLATTGRKGPVWIDIPLDVQASKVDPKKMRGYNTPKKKEPDIKYKITRLIDLLNKAKRPVILAGRGIRLGGGEKQFSKLVRSLNIPILATWRAMDLLDDRDRLFFGRPGSVASRWANFTLQNSDLVITLGARLDLPQVGFNYRHFAPKAKKVIVDIDRNEMKKLHIKLHLAFNVDASCFIGEFLKQIKRVEKIDRSEWLNRCLEWREKYPVVLPCCTAKRKLVNPYVLIETLSMLMGADDILVPGSSGGCAEMTPQAFKVKKGQRVLNSPGLGSMGYGLPQAIGACTASHGKRTICIIGDGGLQHNIQELETLKRLNLPLKLFVLNNNGYASIRNTHKRFFDGRLTACDPSSGLTIPDTTKVAAAYGLKARKIKNQDNLEGDVRSVLEMDGPVVCEVIIDPDLQMEPRLSSKALPNGKMVSSPIEDLWPFLSPEELKSNMQD